MAQWGVPCRTITAWDNGDRSPDEALLQAQDIAGETPTTWREKALHRCASEIYRLDEKDKYARRGL